MRTVLFLLLSTFLLGQAHQAQAQNCTPSFDHTWGIYNSLLLQADSSLYSGSLVWTVQTINTIQTYTGRRVSGQFQGPIYVCLTYTDSLTGCSGTFCDTLVNHNGPNCNGLRSTYTTTVNGNTLSLSATTSGTQGGYAYYWDFGNYGTSTSANPVVVYPALATGHVYEFVHYVWDTAFNCSSFVIDSVYIPGNNNCIGFGATVGANLNGNTIAYSTTPQNGSGNYGHAWNFGSLGTSTNANPSFTFPSSTTTLSYTVTYTLTDLTNNCTFNYVDTVVIAGTGSSNCTDHLVELAFGFDNFANETSWNIIDPVTGIIIASNSYSSAQNGTTLYEQICLPTGCYVLNVYDSWGDGMCCAYGQGSYNLVDSAQGIVLANGSSFGYSDVTYFCVGGATNPCQAFQNASIQYNMGPNGQLTLSTSPLTRQPVVYDWIITNGTNTWNATSANPTFTLNNGYYDIILSLSDSTGCFVTLLDSVFISNNNNALTCQGIVPNMNVYQDSTNPYLIYVVPTLANVPTTYNFQFYWQFGNSLYTGLPAHNFNGYGTFQVCYWAVDSVNNCSVSFCDSITIDSSGTFSRAPMNKFAAQVLPPAIDYLTNTATPDGASLTMTVFPNPAQSVLNIRLEHAQPLDATMILMDVTGRPIQERRVQEDAGNQILTLDMEALPAGMYWVRLVGDQVAQTLSFVKE